MKRWEFYTSLSTAITASAVWVVLARPSPMMTVIVGTLVGLGVIALDVVVTRRRNKEREKKNRGPD